MSARLDHVGIAVQDLDKALAFFRDALGLHIEPPEEVVSQRVRAHFIPVGGSSIELLEATASDSPIARYIEKRGPGIHHLTLRVPDIAEALARLKARGIRLVDQEPRPGAEGALIAFVHPAASHGVLVELKQAARPVVDQTVTQYALGDLRLTAVSDGSFAMDGGAMFGVIPRPVWSEKAPPDDRGRITKAIRALVVEGAWGRILIDCGIGDNAGPERIEALAIDRTRNLDHTMAEAGLTANDIDIVLPTHLHTDHVGGAIVHRDDARVPRFGRARHLIRRGEWDDAMRPDEWRRGLYSTRDMVALAQAGVVDLFDDDREIRPGVRVVRASGHTMHHQVVFLESRGMTAVVAADLVPTTAHVEDPWIAALDLYPVDSLAFKRQLLRNAIDREYLIFFSHDPSITAGYIRERDGRRFVDKVI